MKRETTIIADGLGWPDAAQRALLFGLLLSTAALSLGCAGRMPAPTGGEVAFDLSGRFSVQTDGRATSGNFLWRQFASGFEVDLWGPLGQGRTRLLSAGGGLTLVNARGETLADGDVEGLMLRELGWSAPLDAFAAWVTGQPAPRWPAEVHGEGVFEQLGWRVEVKSWRAVSGRPLPRRIEVTRPGTRIVVVCREWQSPPP